MSDVFLSYSRQNIQFAEKLFNSLKERNISAWVDWQDIPRSAGWWDEIKRGIDNASTFLFLMSNASLSSPVCTLELAHAIENGKRILPVVLEQSDFESAVEKIATLEAGDVLETIIAGRDLVHIARHNHGTIGHINWIFFGKNPQGVELAFDQSFDELLNTIKTDLDHNRRHARLLVLAREWELNERDDDFLLMGDELILGEKWLTDAQSRKKEPIPSTLHIEFLNISRKTEDERNRRLRNIRRASVFATVIAVIAMVVGVIFIFIANQAQNRAQEAQNQAQEAQNQAQQANNQVATATAVIATAVALQSTAQAELADSRAQSLIVSNFANAILRGRENPRSMIAQLTRLIEQYPDEGQAYHMRGLAYYEIGSYDEALTDYNKAIELGLTLNDVYANRGNIFFDLGNYEQAIENYTQAITINPQDALPYNNRGNAYLILGEAEKSLQDFNQSLALDPEYALAYSNRGNYYLTAGDLDLALTDLNRAIEFDPQLTIAYYNRGNVNYDLGNYEQAISDYDSAILLDPDHAQAYTNRGLTYRQLGNLEQSIADYNRAIQLNPQLYDAYVNRGTLYFTSRDYVRAITDYTDAITIINDDSLVYYNRGLCYALTDNYDSAIADFDQTIALGDLTGYLGRGLAHYIQTNYDLAVADWAQYEDEAGEFPANFESFRADALAKIGE